MEESSIAQPLNDLLKAGESRFVDKLTRQELMSFRQGTADTDAIDLELTAGFTAVTL